MSQNNLKLFFQFSKFLVQETSINKLHILLKFFSYYEFSFNQTCK